MKVSGSCHCGKIRYEARIDPEKVVICHCTDCQTLSGSAFRTVVPAIQNSFKLLSGKLKVYIKTAESGNRREQTFCPDCGTPIYSAPAGVSEKIVTLRVGTISQRDRLIRGNQYWFRSSQKWLRHLPEIRNTAMQPVFTESGGYGDRKGK